MSKRKRCSPEYKRELVEVVRRSRSSCRQIALKVFVNPNMLTAGCARQTPAQARRSLAAARHATRRWPVSSANCRR